MAVKHPRGQKRGPEDLRNERMLRSKKELKENRTSHPQLAKLFQLAQLVTPATVGISATIFSARRKKIKAFNALSNKDLQDVHLFGLIKSRDVKRRKQEKLLTSIR